MKAADYEVRGISWPSRPQAYGPAVIEKATGKIAGGPWVYGAIVTVHDGEQWCGPYVGLVPVVKYTVFLPDSGESHTFIIGRKE